MRDYGTHKRSGPGKWTTIQALLPQITRDSW
jgi:hypothetical protein